MTFLFWKSMDLLIAIVVNDWTARRRSGVREVAAVHERCDEIRFPITAVNGTMLSEDFAIKQCHGESINSMMLDGFPRLTDL